MVAMRVEPSSSKQALLRKLLEESMVLVTLDARLEEVRVPKHLRGDPQLRLNLSHRFGLPLNLDENGVQATLTFGGVPYDCELPWSSIYILLSHATGQPFLFPADIPTDARPEQGLDDTAELAPPDEKPSLSVVSGSKEDGGQSNQPNSEQSKAPPKRGHLRVVK